MLKRRVQLSEDYPPLKVICLTIIALLYGMRMSIIISSIPFGENRLGKQRENKVRGLFVIGWKVGYRRATMILLAWHPLQLRQRSTWWVICPGWQRETMELLPFLAGSATTDYYKNVRPVQATAPC